MLRWWCCVDDFHRFSGLGWGGAGCWGSCILYTCWCWLMMSRWERCTGHCKRQSLESEAACMNSFTFQNRNRKICGKTLDYSAKPAGKKRALGTILVVEATSKTLADVGQNACEPRESTNHMKWTWWYKDLFKGFKHLRKIAELQPKKTAGPLRDPLPGFFHSRYLKGS